MNAPGGNKLHRARSRRGHLPESSTTVVESPYRVSGKLDWLLLLWVASKCVGWWKSVQREMWPFSEAGAADSTSPTLHTSSPAPRGSLLPLALHPSCSPFPPRPTKGQLSPELSSPGKGKIAFHGSTGGTFSWHRVAKMQKVAEGGGVNEMQAPRQAAEISLFPWV